MLKLAIKKKKGDNNLEAALGLGSGKYYPNPRMINFRNDLRDLSKVARDLRESK